MWKPVLGFEEAYEVSSLGRVRRIGRAARTGKGHGGGARLGRILRQHTIPGGYQHVQLWHARKRRTVLVHRLVMENFVGPVPAGLEVNHKNGDKVDNSVANLEYMTRSENMRHAYATGLRRRLSGELSPHATVTDAQALAFRTEYEAGGVGQRELARKHGVPWHVMRRILWGQTWKHFQEAG